MTDSDAGDWIHEKLRSGEVFPNELSDAGLYRAYQHAKAHGPVMLVDLLQDEIAVRFSEYVESFDDMSSHTPTKRVWCQYPACQQRVVGLVEFWFGHRWYCDAHCEQYEKDSHCSVLYASTGEVS